MSQNLQNIQNNSELMGSLPTGGGIFGRGESTQQGGSRDGIFAPALPQHGQTGNQPAPLGSGIVVLTALGAAYLVGKRRKED